MEKKIFPIAAVESVTAKIKSKIQDLDLITHVNRSELNQIDNEKTEATRMKFAIKNEINGNSF